MQRPRFLPDNFILALIGAIVLASFLPVQGLIATAYGHATTAAIALLFSCTAPSCPAVPW